MASHRHLARFRRVLELAMIGRFGLLLHLSILLQQFDDLSQFVILHRFIIDAAKVIILILFSKHFYKKVSK